MGNHNTLDFPNKRLGKHNTSKKRWIELAFEINDFKSNVL